MNGFGKGSGTTWLAGVASWGEGNPVGMAGRGGKNWQVIEGVGDGVF